MFEKRVYTDSSGDSLPYRLLKPPEHNSGDPLPLVLFFHGVGERGTDNRKQLKWGVQKFAADSVRKQYPCYITAPQCPPDDKWVATEWNLPDHVIAERPTDALRMALGMTEELITEYPVDLSRVYLTGLSMGGFGAWEALQRKPSLFTAAVIVCGGADTTGMEEIADIPLWIFHGAKDEVVSVERARNAVEKLKKVGATPNYTEYEDIGHWAWTPAYSDPAMYRWLFAQRRK
jgi:predicted peptidase